MIKKVAVIGSGPSGLVALKILSSQGFQLTCFERGSTNGGLWNYTPTPAPTPVPNTDPHHDPPYGWTSAMYEKLETNVERDTMAYGSEPLSDAIPLYMDRTEVLDYVHQYGKEVDHLVRYNHKVLDARKNPTDNCWIISLENGEKHEFDAVVFATGNFNVPNIPERRGMKDWAQKYPGSIIHSKNYRSAETYRNKKVVVVGGSTSAYDIARQLSKTCKTLHQSIRSRSVSSLLGIDTVHYMPDIEEFRPDTRSIIDADGNEATDIDFVIFATGYLRSYPALDQINHHSEYPIVTDGLRMHNVYKHIFYSPDPTLCFLATPNNIVPFPTAEAQSIYVGLVWSGKLELPSLKERQAWEQERVNQLGTGPRFHMLKYPENCDYHMELVGEIESRFRGKEIKENAGLKFHPRVYTQYTRRIRAHMVQLKVGHEKFKKKMGRKAFTIQEMIDTGCFQWSEDAVL